jgi:hypothetical protein
VSGPRQEHSSSEVTVSMVLSGIEWIDGVDG